MSDTTNSLDDASHTVDGLTLKTRDLELTANSFSRAMTQAFAVSVIGGKQFDDVLKSLTLKLSNLSVNLAFKPLQNSIVGGIESLFSGLTGAGSGGTTSFAAAAGAIKPFASGVSLARRLKRISTSSLVKFLLARMASRLPQAERRGLIPRGWSV